jgi:hypothetical protein
MARLVAHALSGIRAAYYLLDRLEKLNVFDIPQSDRSRDRGAADGKIKPCSLSAAAAFSSIVITTNRDHCDARAP